MDNLVEYVVLADIEVSSAQTEVYDCKRKEQFGITKPAVIKKNKMIPINQLKLEGA